MNDLSKFYQSVLQDIRATQVSEEEGGTLEQLFTKWATDLLAEGGETENVRLAYDERALGTKAQHKINAYAISDNYETVDLFISIFRGTEEPERIPKDDIRTAATRIANFFRKGMYKDYENELEESSAIFDFAHTLGSSPDLKEALVRVNVFILTDGLYPGEAPPHEKVSGQTAYYRVVDLEYLSNISEKSHIPIEIDFSAEGFEVPCIQSPSENEDYQSYLAIIPGPALAAIYERYGSRLLEQNVRSFLQFSGKINKGIRATILNEPHMFLAFNNGLAATAESVELETTRKGTVIAKVHDLQIVNGGQTTASIFHTVKKDKADVAGIQVQLKLSVVKNRYAFSSIVSRIAEYANTQNKVSVSDLSSNRPFHVELEKISRATVTPHVPGQPAQTYWFYERARGQYKNARAKDGFTPARQRAFDLKYPKAQVFTKEDLAKYANAFGEVWDGKKLVIGPHMVVRGSQKNYVQFINYNLVKSPDSVYFEDTVAKIILFRAAEKSYGVKSQSHVIGDMRYVTVPYTLGLLAHATSGKLDLYKIWRAQSISESLKDFLYDAMRRVENFIKSNAPGALYGEWAKKEDCWDAVKKAVLMTDLSSIKDDLVSGKASAARKRATDDDLAGKLKAEEDQKLRAVPYTIWMELFDWGKTADAITDNQLNGILNIASKVKSGARFSPYEHTAGMHILNQAIEEVPEILFAIEEEKPPLVEVSKGEEITLQTVAEIVKWDRKHKKLKDFEYLFMAELASGAKSLTPRNMEIARWNLEKVKKYGFKALG